jgi:hypothetical protein
VKESIRRTDAMLGSKHKHFVEQIQTSRVNLWENGPKFLCSVGSEVALVFRELRDARPCTLGWSTHDAEDADELVLVGGARKKRTAGIHLRHDAARRPDIDAGVVGAAT